MTQQPKIDAAYRDYASALMQHHELLSSGGELEEVEDLLANLWDRLDEDQRQSLRGLSSDLNWARRRGEPPPKGRPAMEVTQAELAEYKDAQNAEDWHAILHHLRVCGPALPRDLLAYSRATCFSKLGLLRISVAFTDLTIELSRDGSPVARMAFDALIRLDPATAFHRANEVLSSPLIYPPVVVALSIGYVFDTLGGNAASFDIGKFAGILRGARNRLNRPDTSATDKAAFYQIAGAAMQAFGQVAESLDLYEEGLRLEPKNPAILAGLGMAFYETDKPRAVQMFQNAILFKARFIRPYLHLAHYHLVRREFTKAYGYAKQALDYAGDDRARGAIYDMMAISASELGFDAGQVLQLFREAARCAPSSPRVVANLKAFEDSRAGRSAKAEWDYQEDPAVF